MPFTNLKIFNPEAPDENNGQRRSGVGRQKSGVAGHEVTDAARPGEKGCHLNSSEQR